MPAIAHYIISLILLSIYGLEVCPFIETLNVYEWVIIVTISFAIAFTIRPYIIRRCMTDCNIEEQPSRQFIMDLLLFLGTGTSVGLFNMVFNNFPWHSGAKILVGTFILGFFLATDSSLSRQYNNLKKLKMEGQNLTLRENYLSLPKRFALAASSGAILISAVFILVFIKDLDWMLTEGHAAMQNARKSVIVEVSFIVGVILLEILNAIRSYSRNLRFLLDNQNNTLIEVTNGNLETQVVVGSHDEFGQMALYTNEMITALRDRTIELHRTREATIVSLASLAETRDNETGQHILRTQRYVKALAEHLSTDKLYSDVLTPDVIERLFQSAPLHDVGKVGIPDAILLKPGKLTDDEWEIMKTHPTLGHESLREAEKRLGNNSFLHLAAQIALTHHERWDGSGYPQGLSAEAIPISGRLMALADVYDALISARVYKPAFSHEKAKSIILEGRGTHFDPKVVDAFIAIESSFITIASEFKDEGAS